jgi:glycosyltransferase involved in cell wall biosynthesis
MRILIVTEVFAPGLGGVPMFIERLANQLSLAGDEVMVLTDTASLHVRTQKSVLPSGVKLVRVPAVASVFNRGNNRMSYNPWRAVTRALDEMHPDCIHMHTPAGLLHKIVLKQARRRNIPVVITNHVMPENLTMNLPAFLGTYMSRKVHQVTTAFINRTDYLIAPTQTALDLLGDDITIPKQAITNGIDATVYCPGSVDVATLKKFRINEQRRTVLYTGRLDGEKRVDILIHAFSEVQRVRGDVQLVIVGTGLLDRELRALAAQLNIADSVVFTGRVSDDEKICLLRFATLFVMPSPAELQCISALEALATGLPIVVADQAALLELVRAGKNGYMFSYPDAKDCARAIARLLATPIPKALLEENGRQWIINNHDQAITIRQHQAVYRSLVSGSATVSPPIV